MPDVPAVHLREGHDAIAIHADGEVGHAIVGAYDIGARRGLIQYDLVARVAVCAQGVKARTHIRAGEHKRVGHGAFAIGAKNRCFKVVGVIGYCNTNAVVHTIVDNGAFARIRHRRFVERQRIGRYIGSNRLGAIVIDAQLRADLYGRIGVILVVVGDSGGDVHQAFKGDVVVVVFGVRVLHRTEQFDAHLAAVQPDLKHFKTSAAANAGKHAAVFFLIQVDRVAGGGVDKVCVQAAVFVQFIAAEVQGVFQRTRAVRTVLRGEAAADLQRGHAAGLGVEVGFVHRRIGRDLRGDELLAAFKYRLAHADGGAVVFDHHVERGGHWRRDAVGNLHLHTERGDVFGAVVRMVNRAEQFNLIGGGVAGGVAEADNDDRRFAFVVTGQGVTIGAQAPEDRVAVRRYVAVRRRNQTHGQRIAIDVAYGQGAVVEPAVSLIQFAVGACVR